MIKTGDKAPAFKLAPKIREEVDLANHIGKEKVVLLFFPLAFSSVCTKEMCAMRDDWSAWSKLGAKVFGISVDSPFVTDKFRADNNIPFPILSDFNKAASQAYGAFYPDFLGMKGVSKRAAFVIDSKGTVSYAWISEEAGKEPDYAAVKAAVENAA